ncbi:hypothetical protein [Heyndrickxia faecalis]|uniref:hypothetical protein n=1 Tax=Heyndrickxia faecalis TaxID=2824910 RepID=UPI003D251030
MVTKDEIQDGDVLTLETRLNGEVMQHATTDIHHVPFYNLFKLCYKEGIQSFLFGYFKKTGA